MTEESFRSHRKQQQMIEESFGSHRKQYYRTDQENSNLFALEIERKTELNSLSSLFRSMFLPEGYPSSVSKDYFSYQIWDTLQALCSSVTGVLSNKAILQGMGVGNAEATVSGAAIQWVVKNGSGMVGRIIFAWKNGTSLDYNAKTWRLTADILNDIGMTLEMISPHFPALFLPIACAGTIAMSICGVAGGCSRASLTQHFAIRDNLGDVSAKDGSQETAVSLAGMLIGMCVTAALSSEATGGIVTYSLFFVFVLLHLFCNYRGLRAVRLDTLNRQRAGIFLRHFVRNGKLQSPDEVSDKESILWVDTSRIEIVLGAPVYQLVGFDRDKMQQMTFLYNNEKYFLKLRGNKILIALRKDAESTDILQSYFQALYLRYLINKKKESHLQSQEGITKAEEDALVYITKHSETLLEKMKGLGWNTSRCLLGPSEWRFSLVDQK